VQGVRIDSGDLAAHAREVRRILDDGGLAQARIFASGNLDEHRVQRCWSARRADRRLRRRHADEPRPTRPSSTAPTSWSSTPAAAAQALRGASSEAPPAQQGDLAGPQAGLVEIAGSVRRRCETVGDLDILVTTDAPERVMRAFAGYEDIETVQALGATRATVVLRAGLQVDLRVVEPKAFGAALHYFTGAKAHNIAIRRLGQRRGLKINEYGVFRGERRVAGRTEASVFRAVGLAPIPPELRENRGEIEAARAGQLPRLVTRKDLKGDLHAHTAASDGKNSLAEMAAAARRLGLRYLAITEHSRRLTVAHGLDPERLAKQLDEIDRLNETLTGVTLLKGIEVDILEDGSLDLPDDLLGRLDLVVGAIHSAFALSRAKQTRRILRALDHPHFSILAHPGARLIGERQAIDIDWLRVVRAARARGCFLELNANPRRLDLTDQHCRLAREEGVLVAINADAHSIAEFDNLACGIDQARRGWLEAAQVLNSRPLPTLRKLLRQTL
jgi:DNA polymerase (family X)